MKTVSSNHVPPGFEAELNNIAIDFDGVIHNFDKGWYDGTCYGEPLPGSLDALKTLSKKYNIIIFTAKAKKSRPLVDGKNGVQLVKDWLEQYNVMQYIVHSTHLVVHCTRYTVQRTQSTEHNTQHVVP